MGVVDEAVVEELEEGALAVAGRTSTAHTSDAQIPHSGVDMRCPEGNALGDPGDHLAIIRLPLVEAQLEADLVIRAPAERRQQRLRLDTASRHHLRATLSWHSAVTRPLVNT